MEAQTINAREAARLAIRNLDHVYVAVERSAGGPASTLLAEPLDISPGGIKLRVDQPLAFQEAIKLVLGSVEGPFRMTVSCCVAWLREEAWGSWLVGCQFVPKLTREVLDEMFSSGVIERRQFPRHAVRGHAVAKWQLQPDLFGVWLMDISEAGFCIRCPRAGEVGQRISLKLEAENGTTTVQGRAQWCTAVDHDFLVGCAFLEHASYVGLREGLRFAEMGEVSRSGFPA